MSSSTASLLPGVNHFISLETAKEMTARHRTKKENILIPELRNTDVLSTCETFNREAFDTLLAEKGCVAIRIYFGMNVDSKVKIIAVGVNESNEDILPSPGTAALAGAVGNGNIVEQGQPCPPFCPFPPL